MSIETLLWGVLPAIAGLLAVIVSVYVAFKARAPFHIMASAIAVIAGLWALTVLYNIFVLNAWPTFLPHFVLGIVLVISVAQGIVFARRRRPRAAR